jgi:hypothetical protein
MVFLTSIDILDTGFLDVATRTNQLAAASRVNSGSALRLKGVNLDIASSSALDKAVSPGYRPDDIQDHEKRALISINPTIVTLKIYLNATNDDTTNVWGINDMGLLNEILRLPHTVGWKAIYYPVDITTSTGARKMTSQITHYIGTADTTESQGDIDLTIWTGAASASSKDLTDVNYIPVRFESVKITQIPSNKVEVTMSGVVTG